MTKFDNPNNDKLVDMFNIQHFSQGTRGTWERINESPAMKQQFVNQMILASIEECTEIMRESAYKNPEFMPFGWKKGQQWNEQKFKDECVDLMHFLMNLFMTANGTPEEFYQMYKEKNKINLERWAGNY